MSSDLLFAVMGTWVIALVLGIGVVFPAADISAALERQARALERIADLLEAASAEARKSPMDDDDCA